MSAMCDHLDRGKDWSREINIDKHLLIYLCVENKRPECHLGDEDLPHGAGQLQVQRRQADQGGRGRYNGALQSLEDKEAVRNLSEAIFT